jgi:putative NADH-flavin reductase
MKLAVFGATGGIGSQVVSQALAAGHEVTAIVRRPSAVDLRHECLEVIRGDALEPATLQEPIHGKDAVISALGVSSLAPTTLYSAGSANIIRAMQTGGVRRLVCVSAIGLDPGPPLQRLIAKPILWMIFRNAYRDLIRMEAEVRLSNLDWTILRAAQLTNGPHTRQYQTAVNKHLSKPSSVSRADVADGILALIDNHTTYCATVEVSQ